VHESVVRRLEERKRQPAIPINEHHRYRCKRPSWDSTDRTTTTNCFVDSLLYLLQDQQRIAVSFATQISIASCWKSRLWLGTDTAAPPQLCSKCGALPATHSFWRLKDFSTTFVQSAMVPTSLDTNRRHRPPKLQEQALDFVGLQTNYSAQECKECTCKWYQFDTYVISCLHYLPSPAFFCGERAVQNRMRTLDGFYVWNFCPGFSAVLTWSCSNSMPGSFSGRATFLVSPQNLLSIFTAFLYELQHVSTDICYPSWFFYSNYKLDVVDRVSGMLLNMSDAGRRLQCHNLSMSYCL